MTLIRCLLASSVMPQVLATLLWAQLNRSEQSMKIQELIFAGKYREAEPIVRKCLQQVPREIYFLSQLDIVLNGQGKHRDADELRNDIRKVWEESHKQKWIAKGSPVAEATWARMIAASKAYQVVGSEYFIPEVIEIGPAKLPGITTSYKVIALPKARGGEPRVFKLEMSNVIEEFYVLREVLGAGGRQIIHYGSRRPDIRKLVADAIAYLDMEK